MIATNASYIQNASMTLPDARNYGRTSAYEKNQRRCKCLHYELDADWNPNWTAGKFFTKDEIEEIQGQMNIFDFVN